MMHGAITDDQARALAALVASLHPGWDVPGVRAALHKARHKAPAHELAIAAIRCAMRPEIRTPALIAEDGPHWHGTPTGDAPVSHKARCQVDGHTSYPAWNCGACKADRIGTDTPDTTPVLTLTPEQRDTNLRGIRNVRAVMNREDHQ